MDPESSGTFAGSISLRPRTCQKQGMLLLAPLLLLAVFAYLWVIRRNSTLTRACRWRLDLRLGPNTYRCAACGAVSTPLTGAPNECLRQP